MTSKKVMLTAVLSGVLAALTGCSWMSYFQQPVAPLKAPYVNRHVWAIAPFNNDSGSLQADGLVLADHVQRQLANAQNLDVLPVNRTLEAMQALGMPQVTSPAQAMQLLAALGCDGLVVGDITAYDPYDPPKLGLTLELYVNERVDHLEAIQLRRLTVAASDTSPAAAGPARVREPVSMVSAVLDASDPRTRDLLERYGVKRGPNDEPDSWRRYRISMDLYSEFVAYTMSWRLLEAERQRLAPPPATQPAR